MPPKKSHLLSDLLAGVATLFFYFYLKRYRINGLQHHMETRRCKHRLLLFKKKTNLNIPMASRLSVQRVKCVDGRRGLLGGHLPVASNHFYQNVNVYSFDMRLPHTQMATRLTKMTRDWRSYHAYTSRTLHPKADAFDY